MSKAEKISKQVKDGYNKVAEHFSNTRHSPWQEFKLFGEYIKPGQKILDLGCGNGRLFFSHLKDLNIEYHGVDNSEKLIEIAKKRIPNFQFPISNQNPISNFQIADMSNLPFKDGYFDLVISIASFHHLPNKELRLKTLREVNRVLKPGGYLLMTNWYWRHWPLWGNFFTNFFMKNSLLDFFFPWKSADGTPQCLRYYHLFTKRELKKLHRKANFKIIKIFPHLEAHIKRGVNVVSVVKKNEN